MAGRLDALRERPFRLLFLGQIAGPALAGVLVESRPFVADLREGWDDFRRRTWLWTTVLSAAVGNLLFASYLVLGPLVASRELGGAGAWALIAAAFGVGSLAMSPVGMLMWGPIAAAVGVATALWIAFAAQLASILALFAVREIRELPAHPAGSAASQ